MSRRPKPRREVFPCPNCGADVAAGAKVCRECGSDASTGWKDQDEIDYAQVDLPDGYRDSARDSEELPPAGTPAWVRWTALVVVAAMVGALLFAFTRGA